jgi:hypothetical protein
MGRRRDTDLSLELALTTQSNWQQIYSENRDAVYVDSLSYTPIPAFEVGVTLSTPVVAIRAASSKARGHWKSAGHLFQRFQLGTGGAANPLPQVDSAQIFIPINRVKLVQFDLWQPEYSLVYLPPYWFEQVQVQIWAYTGPITETNQVRFDSIDSGLNRIEGRLTGGFAGLSGE